MIRKLSEDFEVLTVTSTTTSPSKQNMVQDTANIRDDDASVTSSLCSSHSLEKRNRHGKKHHHRRTSSVTFADTEKVLEYVAHDKCREQLWYTHEELSQIKQECKETAKRTRESRSTPERGLEHLVRKESPKWPSRRKRSLSVVFTEHANQILEYGSLCDEEVLARQYKTVAEKSRIQAIARGFSDAEAI